MYVSNPSNAPITANTVVLWNIIGNGRKMKIGEFENKAAAMKSLHRHYSSFEIGIDPENDSVDILAISGNTCDQYAIEPAAR
jgi:hypothetical protein